MSEGTAAPETWRSFWDVTSPEKAARWMQETYGTQAATAAAHCALAADSDARPADYRFWLAVFKLVRARAQRLAATEIHPQQTRKTGL